MDYFELFQEALGDEVYIEEDTQGKCEGCGSTDFMKIEINVVCQHCGAIVGEDLLSDAVDKNLETRSTFAEVNSITPDAANSVRLVGNMSAGMKLLKVWQSIPYQEQVLIGIRHEINARVKKYEEANAGKNYIKIDDVIIKGTLARFKVINDKIITRNPIKMGIIAQCLYYAAKELYIPISQKQLQDILQITADVASEGRNKLNRTFKEHPEIKKTFNTKPLSIIDYIHQLGRKFPHLDEEKQEIFKNLIRRLQYLGIVKQNNPLSILGGVLLCCSEIYGFEISKEQIVQNLSISESTVVKYASKIRPYIYRLPSV